jgi:hypothetical protein
MSIQSEIERINNNVQATLNTIAETGVSVGANSDALPAAAAALANEKVSVNQGTDHAGKLLYVNASGAVTPLALGEGLTIADGVIQAAGGGGGEVLSIEEIRAICAPPSDFEMNYTQVEYIQSTGTQYIDTGIKGQTGITVKGAFMPTTTDDAILTGCYSPQRCYLLSISGAKLRYGYVDLYTSSKTIAAGTKYEYEVDFSAGAQSLTVDGVVCASSTNATQFTNNYNVFLGAYSDSGTAGDFFKGRIYPTQYYLNGALVRDYVPCYRNSDKAVGLYDKVNEQFYGNAGTGSFGYALPVSLPDGYTQLQYIESSGTQYIDTGFKPNQDTAIVMDSQGGDSAVDGKCYMFFGVEGSVSFEFGKPKTSSWAIGAFYNTVYNTALATWSLSSFKTRRTIRQEKNVVAFDSVTHSFTYAAFQSSVSMFLFGANVKGTFSYATPLKLYSCQIYDNGTLVRDYIPCMNAQGVYGLYDTVGAQFYTNAGSGSFTGA